MNGCGSSWRASIGGKLPREGANTLGEKAGHDGDGLSPILHHLVRPPAKTLIERQLIRGEQVHPVVSQCRCSLHHSPYERRSVPSTSRLRLYVDNRQPRAQISPNGYILSNEVRGAGEPARPKAKESQR